MKIVRVDKLKKHFESVVAVHLFTVPNILTIIDTFAEELPDDAFNTAADKSSSLFGGAE